MMPAMLTIDSACFMLLSQSYEVSESSEFQAVDSLRTMLLSNLPVVIEMHVLKALEYAIRTLARYDEVPPSSSAIHCFELIDARCEELIEVKHR